MPDSVQNEQQDLDDLDEAEALAFDSPFRALLDYLESQFPPTVADSAVSSLDAFQKLEGDLMQAVYQSSIFHLARRLVNLAKYAVKQSVVSTEGEVIKEAIELVFDVSLLDDQARLYLLVLECYKASLQKLPRGKRRTVVKQSQENGHYCYICGETLSYSDSQDQAFCDAEHLLPRSLGGGNELINLKGACKACNGFKKDRIAGTDLNYEAMVYPFKTQGQDKISEFHLFAARFFGGGACGICGKSAQDQGRLEVRSKEDTDAWHLFNALLVCPACSLKLTI